MHIDCDNRWYIKDLVNDITNQRSGDRQMWLVFGTHCIKNINERGKN